MAPAKETAMAIAEKAVAYIEMEDYLVLENASRYKHEYLAGVIYAVQGEPARGMAGGSAVHADLIRNVGFALHKRLMGTPCSVKMTEMRLRVEAADAMFYPDVMVHCRPVLDPSNTLELTEARLIVEVLSPSTQRFDGGQKLSAYRKLPGLQHIVLVSSLEQAAWACHRVPADADWSALSPWTRGTALALEGLGLSLPWGEIYDGVGLD
jgi:Uma2 family endonuclease